MSKSNLVIVIAGLVLPTATSCSEKSTGATAPPSDTTSTAAAYGIRIDTNTTIDSANVEAGSTIPVRVVAIRNGSPVVGGPVAWTIGSGHGTLSSSTSTTDSLGYAGVLWTVGDTVGLNSLTAVIGTASVTVRAAGIAGIASALLRVSDDSVWVVGGASALLTARALDRFGNAVAGARVTWSATNGDLSATESITGTSGNADAAITAPMMTGVSSVTATLEGKASVRFRVVVTYDTANGVLRGVATALRSNDDFKNAGRQLR